MPIGDTGNFPSWITSLKYIPNDVLKYKSEQWFISVSLDQHSRDYRLVCLWRSNFTLLAWVNTTEWWNRWKQFLKKYKRERSVWVLDLVKADPNKQRPWLHGHTSCYPIHRQIQGVFWEFIVRQKGFKKGVSGIWRERQFIHLSVWILAHPPVLFHAATPTVQRWAHVLHKLKLHGEHLCMPHKA